MKKTTAILLIMIMLVLPAAAFAEGTAGLSFSGDDAVGVGEVFAVVVTFSAEENIAALQAEFTYDDEMIRFLSGGNSVQAEGGVGSIFGNGGAQSLSYSLEFRAMTVGETSIEIANVEIISDETGMILGSPSGSVSIMIEEPAAAEPEEEPAEPQEDTEEAIKQEEAQPSQQPAEELPEADVIVIEDKKYIPTDAEITGYMLLGDEDGKLWLYRTSDGTLTEYTELRTNVLYQPAEIPSSVKADASVQIDGVECEALTTDKSGCYLVYLTDGSQNAAWYSYDEETELLRKAEVVENIVETVVENKDTAMLDIITLALAGVIVIALIVLILVLRRKRR